MEQDMTKGKPLPLMIRFMIPLILGNVFQQFYTMADTIIVGRFVSLDGLAAVGSTGSIVFLINGFIMGLSIGFTVLTAQRYGARDMEGVKKSVGSAAILGIVIALILTFMSIAFMDPLLKLMNTPENIFQEAKSYITIICIGLICTGLYNLMASLLRAVGNSKVPLYFLIISAFLNIGLDLLFIIVFKAGVAGAALATIISQGVSGILCVIFVIKKVPVLHPSIAHWKPDVAYMKEQLSVGVPMALQFSITAVGAIMVQSSLNLLGSTVVGSYTASVKVEQLFTQPLVAVGMTLATFSAQNRGVNDFVRIRKGVRIGFAISSIYAIVIGVVAVLVIPYAIRLFVSAEEALSIVGYAKTYMQINAACFIPLGMIFIFRNVLQACGQALIPMLGGVLELVCRAIVAYIAAQRQSFTGVCFANASAWLFTGIFLCIVYFIIINRLQRKAGFPKD